MNHRVNKVAAVGAMLWLAVIAASGGKSADATVDDTTDWLSDAQRAELTQLVESASAPLSFTPAGDPIDVSSLDGKRVFVVAVGLDIPFAQTFLEGMREAAAVAGMTVDAGDGQTNPAEQSRLLRQAVAQGYDAIVLYAIDPAQVNQALLEVKAAGIPIITAFVRDPGLPTEEEAELGIVAMSTYCYSCAARLAADYALLNSSEPVHAKFFGWEGAISIDQAAEAYQDEIAKYCSECSVEFVNLAGDYATIGQRITTSTIDAVSDGETNVIHTGIDVWLVDVLSTTESADAGDIMLTSFNGSTAQLQSMKSGSAIKADVGAPIFYSGYALMDQVYRALLGEAPVEDVLLGLRLFSADNIGEIDPTAPENVLYYGENDIAGDYRRSWGSE
jgi:ribose transport system substrate-binding protein